VENHLLSYSITSSILLSKKKFKAKSEEDEYNFNDDTVGTNEDDAIDEVEDASERDMFEESYADQIIEEEDEEEDEENDEHLLNGEYTNKYFKDL
jgi:hypothetical protein